MIRKSTASIEDRDRLIIDRNDGTSLADFQCKYVPEVPGKVDEVKDKVTCVFATNGPYLYKVTYERNTYAGLIFKTRTKYELFSDNHPEKVAFNDKYIAVIATKATNERTNLLVYRDSKKNGSSYLYAGIDLNKISNMPTEEYDFKITEDDHLIITINNKESMVFRYHIRDLKIRVNNVEALSKDLWKNHVRFNRGSDYKSNIMPFKYFFEHLNNQRKRGMDTGGSLRGWILLIAFVILTIYIAYTTSKDITKAKNKIRDSGVDVEQYGQSVIHDESIVGLTDDNFNDGYATSSGGIGSENTKSN